MDSNVFKHIKVSNKQFDGSAISFDNMRFENCQFKNCDLFYSGGPTEISSCAIESGNRWHFQGAAALTIETLQALGFQVSGPGQFLPGASH